MGIHGGGSPGEAARFLRITRCTSVPAFSPIIGGDLGLVSVVSLFCVIAVAWTSPFIIDQAQNVWAMRIKKGRHQPGNDDDKSCHKLR